MIRKATYSDIESIMPIYDSARNFMRSRGNTVQWVNGYPSEQQVRRDIDNGNLYVGTIDERIAFVFAFILGEDPTYSRIDDGQWLDDAPYGTIHRLATLAIEKGAFESCLRYCLKIIDNIRMDTHEQNLPMRKIAERFGFVRCGIIYVAAGTPRIAYQTPRKKE